MFYIEIEKELPLTIKGAVFESEELTIWGEDWEFYTSSPWRVVSKHGLLFGCGSAMLEEYLATLLGQSIVTAKPFGFAGIDPQFMLSDGRLLEIFSDQHLDPWTFDLPGGSIFVA